MASHASAMHGKLCTDLKIPHQALEAIFVFMVLLLALVVALSDVHHTCGGDQVERKITRIKIIKMDLIVMDFR